MATPPPPTVTRRRFLEVLGVTTGGAAAVTACGGDDPTKLIPYLVAPEDQVPGIATYYATSCHECPAGCGLHAKVREGRAIKLEGNPDHPVNRGGLCALGQAGLQGLYNPDRLNDPMARAADGSFEKITWDDALARLVQGLERARGKGIAFVTGHEAGSFGALVDEWVRGLGAGARRVPFEPLAYEALREGNRIAFGTSAIPTYDFAAARFVLSFGADFLETWLAPVTFMRGYAAGRAPGDRDPARHVAVGPRLSLTGMNADQWLAVPPGLEGDVALALAHVITRERLMPGDVSVVRSLLAQYTPELVAGRTGISPEQLVALARQFAAGAPGSGLAVAGGMAAHYPNGAEIVAAVNILNYVAGNVGRTVRFPTASDAGTEARGTFRGLTRLVQDLEAGAVGALLVHGANPAYALPGRWAQAAAKVPFKVAFSSYWDESAAVSDLLLPDHHPLEQWNDAAPRSGVYGLMQPVMQPVFNTRQTGDVLLQAAARMAPAGHTAPRDFKAYLQGRWRELHRRLGGGGGAGRPFEQFWNESLQRGGVWSDSPTPSVSVRLSASAARIDLRPPHPEGSDIQLIAFPSPLWGDGRGANKPWLQESFDPVTKISWHAWVEVNPTTAQSWGVVSGDVVHLESPHGMVRAPVYIYDGVLPGVVAVPTGQGHTAYGRYARDRSFNAFQLLPSEPNAYGGRDFVTRVSVQRTGDHRRLATNEGSPRELGRGLTHTISAERHRELKEGGEPLVHEERFPVDGAAAAIEGWAAAQNREKARGDYARKNPRWAMAIDLSRCTGCGACVTACYAENNIPVVGEDQVLRGREMTWLRIERYFTGGDHDTPLSADVLPMLCQQCGNAPCEPVCPVFASYHTADGLNGQVYNRCVGTRYCANNCPYKVRYFNWWDYQQEGDPHHAFPAPLTWQLNPDVTVRSKGIMEKCTFCVQRIRGAQNQARLEDRAVRDGDITPACAQTCPAEAIVFGDLNDPASRVSALARDARAYHVLEGLNTLPAVSYLARVVNREGTDGGDGHS